MNRGKLMTAAVAAVLVGGVALAEPNGDGGAQRGLGRGPRPAGVGQASSEQHGQPGEGGVSVSGGVGGEPRGGRPAPFGPTSRPSPDQLFDRADMNKDGSLSREEFKKFIESRPPRPPRPPEGGEGEDGGGGNRRPPPPPKD